ncbi:MAG TPA: hypothetical protein VKZ84_01215 [Bacteriovoracaceae bacterium]|nr:hypothetical protein [Bacteriovoracaceae bacterium]
MRYFLLLLLFSSQVMAQNVATDEKVVGLFYFLPLLGHVHQSPEKTSASLTTIQCSHPVKVIESSKVVINPSWAYVEVADYRGFIRKEFLSEKRPDCFQGRYPNFFDGLNLDLSELYYWGRLYDQYIQVETRVR